MGAVLGPSSGTEIPEHSGSVFPVELTTASLTFVLQCPGGEASRGLPEWLCWFSVAVAHSLQTQLCRFTAMVRAPSSDPEHGTAQVLARPTVAWAVRVWVAQFPWLSGAQPFSGLPSA